MQTQLSQADLRAHLLRKMALGFGLGRVPFIPGTAGTAGAWLIFWLSTPWVSELFWLGFALLGVGFGVWCCGKTARELGLADAPCIVWDEMVAFWLILTLLPSQHWHLQLLVLLLRRPAIP